MGPFSGAILAALVYEIGFRPDYDSIIAHRGPGIGLFPGMAGVEGEEKTGAAGDVLPANAVTGGIAEGGGLGRRQPRRAGQVPPCLGLGFPWGRRPLRRRLPCAGQWHGC